MMSHRILPAALLLCTLAACGDLPTQQGTQAQPAGPAYDGGFGMGSGNSATQSSGYDVGAENGVEGGGVTIGSGGAENGGLHYGSGNGAAIEGGAGFGSGTLDAEAPATDPPSGTAPVDGEGRGGFGMGSGN